MPNRHTQTFTATPDHIDIMGHVNNAVWVQWMEALATQHWRADASPEQQATYIWLLTRHEIDYRGNIVAGQQVHAETFIPDPPKGARFDRCIDFTPLDADGMPRGRPIVSARSTWAMLDAASGRLMRVPADVAAVFAPDGGWPRAESAAGPG